MNARIAKHLRSLQWRMIAIVGGILLLVVVTGGAVVRRFEITDDGCTTTTIAEGLVVATAGDVRFSKFQGMSTTTFWGEQDRFQTCYKSGRGSDAKYCWTNAHQTDIWWQYFQCVPNGDGWKEVNDNKYHLLMNARIAKHLC